MRTRSLLMAAVLLAVLAAALFPLASGEAGREEAPVFVDPAVRAQVSAAGPNDLVSVIVRLRSQANIRSISGRTRGERLTALVRLLQSTAEASQAPIRVWLHQQMTTGSVREIRPVWIFNGIAVTGTKDAVNAIASRSDVASVTVDAVIPAPLMPSSGSAGGAPSEANLGAINAPALWELGFTGLGVVVASMDTGVDVTHPDLAGRWRGGSNSWYDPSGQHPGGPVDFSGHGTWTMGVMVGGDRGGTQVGVAPESQWIAVKIFDDGGTATVSRIHMGFQWLLDPDGNPQTDDAPHVVNNSWGFASPGCNLEFQPDLQALLAAGILPVFAAGNLGPGSGTAVSPANYPEALGVGATDDAGALYTYSSRGPSACGEVEATYPDVVAPGVDIRTTDLYGLYYSPTGTSLAAPHVAGAASLLLSAFPELSPGQLRGALVTTAADSGAPGPDNDYGYGRIDVQAALGALSAQFGTPVLFGDVNCDRDVTFTDAALIADYVVAVVPNLTCVEGADVNGDGRVRMSDALLVSRLLLRLTDRFS